MCNSIVRKWPIFPENDHFARKWPFCPKMTIFWNFKIYLLPHFLSNHPETFRHENKDICQSKFSFRSLNYWSSPVGSYMLFKVQKVWELELLLMMVTNNVSGDSFAVRSTFGSKLAQIQMRVYANFYEKYLSSFGVKRSWGGAKRPQRWHDVGRMMVPPHLELYFFEWLATFWTRYLLLSEIAFIRSLNHMMSNLKYV